MNEIFDKLTLRVIFAIYLCLIIYFYKYAHSFLYPSSKNQFFRRFYPTKNITDTIHLLSRVIGIGIIFSSFYFTLDDGFFFALLDFLIYASVALFLYLISIYIIESIVLYNFEYIDEITKRKNMAYAVVSFSQAIAVAYIIKVTISVSHYSITALIFLWLFSMVLIGFASKGFSYFSKLHFNRQMVQKNLGIAFSYMGFLWGITAIVTASMNHEMTEIKWFGINVILKVILALIILPIFYKGLILIFNIQEEIDFYSSNEDSNIQDTRVVAYGIYEGAIIFTSCFLTKVITEQVMFGTFYPVF